MENEIKITNVVPIPKVSNSLSSYPFAKMKVGDSFWVKGKVPNTLYNASYRFCKKNGIKTRKFVARKEGAGSRVWRTQ